MEGHSSNLDDFQAIRLILQRHCRAGGRVRLEHGSFTQDVPLHLETADHLVLGIPDLVRGQWGLKPGTHVLATLEDRGKQYEAVLEMTGHGSWEGLETCTFTFPRLLKCLNDEQLSDFWPERSVPCTYSTHSLAIADGKLRAFGAQGAELCWGEAETGGTLLRVGDATAVEMVLGAEGHRVAPAKVVFFGDGFAGLHFQDEPGGSFMPAYRRWLAEMIHSQHEKDQGRFEPEGSRSAASPRASEPHGSVVKVLVDHDPMLLVLSEGEAFPQRMAASLGRKFGLAHLDYLQGKVRPALAALGVCGDDWGRVRLLLVHQRLRVSSGLELTRELVHEEHCPLPILVVGLEDDVPIKRNRAIAAGAVDFISVEPFHVIRVMQAIEDTFRMFG